MSILQTSVFGGVLAPPPDPATSPKQAAIYKVGAAADPDWKEAAILAVHSTCLMKLTFTTDDVWLALKNSSKATHERRAIGAVMVLAAKKGYCETTGTVKISQRKECHNRPVMVWRSLICTHV